MFALFPPVASAFKRTVSPLLQITSSTAVAVTASADPSSVMLAISLATQPLMSVTLKLKSVLLKRLVVVALRLVLEPFMLAAGVHK